MPSIAPQRLIGYSLVLACAALAAGCANFSNPLSGSASNAGATPAPRPVQVCQAQAVQSFVGKNNTASTMEAARKQAGAYMARVLGENQATTMEFDQERLNLIVNAAGRITAVRCG